MSFGSPPVGVLPAMPKVMGHEKVADPVGVERVRQEEGAAAQGDAGAQQNPREPGATPRASNPAMRLSRLRSRNLDTPPRPCRSGQSERSIGQFCETPEAPL